MPARTLRRAPSILLRYLLLSFTIITSPVFAQEPELVPEDQKDFVSDILPYDLAFVRDHINLEFSSNDRAFYEDYNGVIYRLPGDAKNIKELTPEMTQTFLDFPLVRSNKFYVFFSAYRHMQQALQEVTPYMIADKDNAALQRYAALPPKDRRNDIYLWSPDSPYWYSEYTYNGNPVPFRTYFIIHLSKVDNDHTKVEVIEDKPVVSMGKKLSVDANGTIQHYNIRDVAPTTRDREFLLSCINQFIDRKVPGRQWFTCRDESQ